MTKYIKTKSLIDWKNLSVKIHQTNKKSICKSSPWTSTWGWPRAASGVPYSAHIDAKNQICSCPISTLSNCRCENRRRMGKYMVTWEGHVIRITTVVFALFATDKNLQRLQRCQDVYMDGTFPNKPHKQFFTIHGKYMGRLIPFVFILLTGETTGHYCQLLQMVKREIRQKVGHRWRPNRIICDFEQSIVNRSGSRTTKGLCFALLLFPLLPVSWDCLIHTSKMSSLRNVSRYFSPFCHCPLWDKISTSSLLNVAHKHSFDTIQDWETSLCTSTATTLMETLHQLRGIMCMIGKGTSERTTLLKVSSFNVIVQLEHHSSEALMKWILVMNISYAEQ